MREFTFITICFNQEKFILEHLESIKSLIMAYGQNIECDYVLADDCSSDSTVQVAERWLEKNHIFRNITLIKNSHNVGIVKNIYNAVIKTHTKYFKFLAADDKYYHANIFKLFQNIDGKLILTLPKAFGFNNPNEYKWMEKNFKLLQYYSEANKLYKLLEYGNLILAAGVFLDGNLLRDKELWNCIFKFKYIEDYPMWNYLICNKHYPVDIIKDTYIFYRINSGVTSATNDRNNEFLNEDKIMREYYGLKYYKFPQYINPYRYILKVSTMLANRKYK